jgi:hypothetical protein
MAAEPGSRAMQMRAAVESRLPRRFATPWVRFVATALLSFVALVVVYAVAGAFTHVQLPLAAGDAPRLLPLTGGEKITVTRGDHHSGAGSTRVVLPAAPGTQGAYFTHYLLHPAPLLASLWLRAPAGKEYSLVATNQAGRHRAVGPPVAATGQWQRLTLRVLPRPGDTVVYLSILRQRRGGEESFDVDDVSVLPVRGGG